MRSPLLGSVALLLLSTAACSFRERRHRETTTCTETEAPGWTEVIYIATARPELLHTPREDRAWQPPAADARLRRPDWVPEAGRLTVVAAPDLAKNLGQPRATTVTSSTAATRR